MYDKMETIPKPIPKKTSTIIYARIIKIHRVVNVTEVIDWREDIYDNVTMSKCNGQE